jgi:glycosyltransferase involved in cell wall biosynthesis
MGKKIKINFFKTNNYIDLAQLILKIWDNKKLLTSQVDKNKKIIKQYSWDNISNEYLKLFINISSKKFNF